MTVKVTDSTGAPLVGAKVTATGPATRAAATDATGTVRFLALRGGNYRLRFESPTTITLERDVVLRAGAEPIEVTPSPAPPPPPPPPPPEPTRSDPISGRGPLQAPQPRTVAIPEFVDRNKRGSREPAKTTQVACGATSVTNLVQIREPLKDQSIPTPTCCSTSLPARDSGAADRRRAAVVGTFSLIPRGTTYTLQRNGRNDLFVLMSLTDTPCPAK